jgi:hypothetical protein
MQLLSLAHPIHISPGRAAQPIQAFALAGQVQEQGDQLRVEVQGFMPHCGGLAMLREPVVVLVSQAGVAAVQDIEPPTRKEK